MCITLIFGSTLAALAWLIAIWHFRADAGHAISGGSRFAASAPAEPVHARKVAAGTNSATAGLVGAELRLFSSHLFPAP